MIDFILVSDCLPNESLKNTYFLKLKKIKILNTYILKFNGKITTFFLNSLSLLSNKEF